jgi:nicotinamidase-related amidase
MARLPLATVAAVAIALAIGVGPAAGRHALAQVPAPVPDALAVPAPAAVTLSAGSTAFLVIDMLAPSCDGNPNCLNALPGVENGLAAARAANALVVYSVHPAPDSNITPEVAPATGDPIFVAIPGDKFFNSNLDTILRQAGISTLVLTGSSSNVGVLYTAGAAIQRGYTVVVAEDGIVSASDLGRAVALWQMLHGPGANADNTPLKSKSVTLSRTDLIAYR